MKALLDALESGRLIELPENDKQKALTLLASVIEAVPSVKADSKIVEGVLSREAQANTYLAHGWAVPHTRSRDEGELLCAVGWSPTGIVYGNKEGPPVNMLLLYHVPDSQRAAYLKEISALARLLNENAAVRDLSQAPDLNFVRMKLLEIIAASVGTGVAQADARARMIQLEARAREVAPVAAEFDTSLVMPAWVIGSADGKAIVLARDDEVVRTMEALPDLAGKLLVSQSLSLAGYRIFVRQSSTYGFGRSLLDCLVIKGRPASSNGAPR